LTPAADSDTREAVIRLEGRVDSLDRSLDVVAMVGGPLLGALVLVFLAVFGLQYFGTQARLREALTDVKDSQRVIGELLQIARQQLEDVRAAVSQAQETATIAADTADRLGRLEAEATGEAERIKQEANRVFERAREAGGAIPAEAAPEAPSAAGGLAPAADQQVEELLRRLPASSYVYFLVDGKRLLLQGRFLEAVDKLEKAKEVNPDDAETRLYLGRAYAAGGNPHGGISEIQQAIALGYPDVVHALNALAEAHRAAHELGAALDQYEAILRDHSVHDTSALLGKGHVLEQMGRWQEAAAHWSRAAELVPANWNFICFRGRAYLKLGEEHAGRTDLETVMRNNPGDNKPYIFLADWELERGHASEAIGWYREALARSESAARSFKGMLYGKIGEACLATTDNDVPLDRGLWSDAMAAYRSAVECAPEYVSNYMGLAKAYIANGKYTDALPPATRGIQVAQRSPGKIWSAALYCIAAGLSGTTDGEFCGAEDTLLSLMTDPRVSFTPDPRYHGCLRAHLADLTSAGDGSQEGAAYASDVLDLLERHIPPSEFSRWVNRAHTEQGKPAPP
jgi:tetratricopeptide (TPR) repeat protein